MYVIKNCITVESNLNRFSVAWKLESVLFKESSLIRIWVHGDPEQGNCTFNSTRVIFQIEPMQKIENVVTVE